MTLILSLVLAVSIFQFYKHPIYLIPIFAMLGFYAFKLKQKAGIYQRHRHWQIKYGQLILVNHDGIEIEPNLITRHHPGIPDLGQPVKLLKLQAWRPLVLFTYELNGRKFNEIITIDAVDHEAFRQFRCMIKLL